jgi:23S rRNA (cytidine2498-2'-O)-methyltransferase
VNPSLPSLIEYLEPFAQEHTALSGFFVYQAPHGFLEDLLLELGPLALAHTDDLILAKKTDVLPAWAQNAWLDVELISIKSIGDGARALKSRGRIWNLVPTAQAGRAKLIQSQLAHWKSKPLSFLGPLPTSSMGAWTLLSNDLLLASRACSSPFPNGEVEFLENKELPPSRAYLKLWELFTVHGIRPETGTRVMDLGSCPGGWTWVLQSIGCQVLSVDKAPLAPQIAGLEGIEYLKKDAFSLQPSEVGAVDWLFSDIICYPERLFELVEKWRAAGVKNFVCTIKFQGATDFATTARFAEIPHSRVIHLHHNKHELTWVHKTP